MPSFSPLTGAAAAPPAHSLVGSARRPDPASMPRWETGFSWIPERCQVPWQQVPQCTPLNPAGYTVPRPGSAYHMPVGWRVAQACSTLSGAPAGDVDRLRRIVDAQTPFIVARELWEGSGTQADPYTIPDATPAPGVQEVQQIAISGAPTGGTWTLTLGAETTSPIAWDATAAQVQAALLALPSVDAVAVTGGPAPGNDFTVTFDTPATAQDRPQMTGDASGLTGGAPAVTVTTTQEGSAPPPDPASTNGYLASPAATVVGATGDSPLRALGELVAAAGEASGGQTVMIHVPPIVVPFLADAIRPAGSSLLTLDGHQVVADAGYPGTGPAGQAAGATVWAYATSIVSVLLSPIVDDDVTDHASNTRTVWAERLHAAFFDPCVHVATEITLPT